MFSIIVPVYNAEKYIHKCISSVENQTYQEYELILVNDGSSDESGNICNNYADSNSRIKVVHQKNKGATAARKNGLEQSTGQYVMFLDSDDWLEKDALEKCYRSLQENSVELIVFGNRKFLNGNVINESTFLKPGVYGKERIEETVFPHLMMDEMGGFFPRALWGKVYQREVIKKHLYLVPELIRNGEDMCCIISLIMECESMSILPHYLYCYRAGEAGSVSRSGDEKALIRGRVIAEFLQTTARIHGWKDIQQLYRLLVQQIYSASLRASDAIGVGQQFKSEFDSLLSIPLCKEAISSARFSASAKTLLVKQFILRYRLFGLMFLIRKIG